MHESLDELLVVFMLNVPVNNFQSCQDGATASCVVFSFCREMVTDTMGLGFDSPTSRSVVH